MGCTVRPATGNPTMPLAALPQPTAFDLAHLATCHSSVRTRRLIELAVARKALTDLIASGHPVRVHDGEEFHAKTTDVEVAMEQCFAVDEARVYTVGGKESGRGWVLFVFGNDGWDAVCDYTVNLESVLTPANEYAESLAEWA